MKPLTNRTLDCRGTCSQLLKLFLLGMAMTQMLSAHTSAQTLAEKEAQWQSCEAGHYAGPRDGRRSYTLDNYLWVVTPEFAKRFCMPESLVSSELKGAEAIAFRMVDGADMDRCRVDEQGQHQCIRQSVGRFEIYLPQSLKLPASNPDVRFFDARRNTSNWLIENHTPIAQSKSNRYAKGEYIPPPGTVPRFRNAFGHPDSGYIFGLWYDPPTSKPWPSSALFETAFHEAALPGVNLLILENTLGIHLRSELNHYRANKVQPGDPKGRYVIVMHKRDTATVNKEFKQIPNDFEHVIYLPHSYALRVRDIAMGLQTGSSMQFLQTLPTQ